MDVGWQQENQSIMDSVPGPAPSCFVTVENIQVSKYSIFNIQAETLDKKYRLFILRGHILFEFFSK